MTFEQWWAEFKTSAEKSKLSWVVNESDPESYRELFDDDWSPDDAVHQVAAHADDGDSPPDDY